MSSTSVKDYKTLLGFTDRWFSWGILTEEDLRLYGAEYEASGDTNTEHYRCGAFQWYLQQHRPLSALQAEALYELADADPDLSMGGNVMGDIVRLTERPADIRAKALTSGRKHLVRIVQRQSLLDALQHDLPTPELFERCIKSGDRVVHLGLLEKVRISREQLEVLAARGANRAIRNMAADRLRRKF